jgi:SAM-dependent methyltransferase
MSAPRQTTFTSEEYANAYPEGIERHYWTLARNYHVARLLRRAPGSGGLVLDIGCGRGLTVEYLRGLGFDCRGFELSDVAIPAHLQAHCASSSDAFALPEELRSRVGAILLLDVLEHLEDPAGFLDQCVTSFPALQSLVVTVPARMELWSNYDDYYGHKTRYDLPSLQALVAREGLKVAEIGYFFHALYPPLRLVNAFLGRREIRYSAPRLVFVHRLLACGLAADSFLPRRWYGSSIAAILHRVKVMP